MKFSVQVVLLFLCMFSLFSLHANAEVVKSGDWIYEVVDDHVELVSYRGTDKDVVLPQKLEGLPVTIINSNALNGDKLTSVVIPNGVEKIGSSAFGSNRLTQVKIPDSVRIIGQGAFERNKLTSVTIPNNITEIADYTFMFNQLKSVALPASLQQIGVAAFTGNQLQSIELPQKLQKIDSRAFRNNKLAALYIPENVNCVGNRAFAMNDLTSLTISHPLQMDNYAFEFNHLTQLTLSDDQTDIPDGAFSSNDLTHVALPKSLQSIGDSAFQSNHLKTIKIPEGVKTIPDFTFYDNELEQVDLNQLKSTGYNSFAKNHLETLDFPKSLTSIGRESFENNKLTMIDISDHVMELGNYAFRDNPLKRVTLSKNIENISKPFGEVLDTVNNDSDTAYLLGWYVDPTFTTEWNKKAGQTVYPKWNHDPKILGITNEVILQNTTFDIMDGISAIDEEDGDITKKIKVSGKVDTTTPGTYWISYAVTDADGYYSEWVRSIKVISIEKPVFENIEDFSVTIGVPVFLYEVKVSDKEDGKINDYEVIGTVKTNEIGRYVITYKAVDTDGNKTQLDRTITVLPGKVQNVQVTKRTMTTLTFNWKAQKGTTGYKIYVYDHNGKLVKTENTTKASIVLSSLQKATPYKVKVRAYKKFDDGTTYGSSSDSIKVVTLPATTKLKDVVKNSTTSFTAKWSKVNASGYELQYSTSKKFTVTTTKSFKLSKATYVSKKVTGLKKGKKYYVRVRSFVTQNNVKYYGAWSNIK